MSVLENYPKDAFDIETELVRKGIAIGLDWADEVAVRALAHEAIYRLKDEIKVSSHQAVDYQLMARIDLFGLAGVMLKTMQESAEFGIETHGGPAWKSFAKALWAELD